MKVDVRREEAVTVLELEGKLKLGEEGLFSLRDAVTKGLEAGERGFLLVMGDVPMIDSSGVGELVRCYTSITRRDGQLKLVALTPAVKHVMEICGLLTVFEVFADPDEAIGSF